MPSISPQEASLLALLAERPARNSGVTRRAFSKLGDKAKEVANALRDGGHGVNDEASQTAQGLHDWVKTNRAVTKRRK
jgi:hypothetical protein